MFLSVPSKWYVKEQGVEPQGEGYIHKNIFVKYSPYPLGVYRPLLLRDGDTVLQASGEGRPGPLDVNT